MDRRTRYPALPRVSRLTSPIPPYTVLTMKPTYYITYGEAVYGPFSSEREANNHARTRGWFSFMVYDNYSDALAGVESNCER